MGNWRDLYTGWSGDLANPDAPAGGGGPGFFRVPGPTGALFDDSSFVPHPDAPAARLEHHDYAQFDLGERVRCVSEAITKAQSIVGPAIQEETGYALKELLAGILPGLVLTLSILAGSAALGGMVGTALGALAGGVGALPGAAAGAAAGFEAGLFILNLLGVGFLAFYLAKHLSQVTSLLARGVRTAWDAPASPLDTHFMVNAAAADLAHAIAVLIRLILEAIVAYLLTKGAASASSRVPELVAQLRKSKLGEGFAGWVEKNWEGLLGNKKLQGKGAKDGLGSGTGRADEKARVRPRSTASEQALARLLGDTKVRNVTSKRAEEVNGWWRKEKGYMNDPYKPGTEALEFELAEPKTFARVYDETNSFQKGGWLVKKEDIAGLTPEQIRDKYALPQTPKYITDVRFPAGARLRIGEANSIAGWGNGEGTQLDMMGQRGIGEQWLNPRPIK